MIEVMLTDERDTYAMKAQGSGLTKEFDQHLILDKKVRLIYVV